MKSPAITVEPTHTPDEARALLQKHRIRQLPVAKGTRLLGIITDRDLRSAPATAASIAEIMTEKPQSIGPDASVDEAARLIRAHRIGALPVVDGNKLIGIISATDILDAFVDLSGVGEPTYRIIVGGAKGRNAEQRIRQIVHNSRAELKWIHPDTHDTSKMHVRVKARRVEDIVTGLEAAGFDVAAVVAPSASRA